MISHKHVILSEAKNLKLAYKSMEQWSPNSFNMCDLVGRDDGLEERYRSLGLGTTRDQTGRYLELLFD